MKLSTRARYALRMMIVVAREADGTHAVSLSRISRSTMISRRYLEQVVAGLRRCELLRSMSGRTGGYLLTRPATEITLREIVEAAIGPINVVECVGSPERCLKADVCECRWVYQKINQGIRDVLEDLTLEDLVDPPWARPMCWEMETEGHPCPTSGA